MIEPIVLVGRGDKLARLAHLRSEKVRSGAEVKSAFERHRQGALWVASDEALLQSLAGVTPPQGRKTQRLLLLEVAAASEREFLRAIFQRVIAPDVGIQLVPPRELAEILASPDRVDHFIGGTFAPAFKSVVLYRGNFERMVVPAGWFKSTPRGPRPDFKDFEVIDFGQTVRLGDYEAAGGAILYEFDADYRRRAKQLQLQEDTSFGGGLRRLRLQKGLSRSEFPGLTPKEIARIERGEVKRPHRSTIAILAVRLRVPPEEIRTY